MRLGMLAGFALVFACGKGDSRSKEAAPIRPDRAQPNEPPATPDAVMDVSPTQPPSPLKSLGPVKQIDAVLEARCDKANSDVKIETLSEKTAALAGLPAGDLGQFYCGLKGDVGLAKWDDSLVDANLYSISIFGDAIKPGNRWSQNHFARLGAEFAKPLLTPAGQTRLARLVDEYASKAPEAGTRWTIEKIVINLNQVLAGDQEGKWVMGITPARDAPEVAAGDHAEQEATPVKASEEIAPPVKVTASSTQKAGPGYTYVPTNLTDAQLTSSWQPATGSPPTWFRLDFANDITVTSIAIANGFQANDKFGDEFLLNSRISNGRLRFSDDSEVPIKFEADARGLVSFSVPQRKTRSVIVFVDDVFRGTKWNDLAVSEIEVRALK